MKILISVLLIVISTKDCAQKSTILPTSRNEVSENLKITYEAFSRGYFKSITFENSKMMYSNDLNRKKIDTLSINTKEWNELIAIVNSTNLKSLENLQAPTDKRLYDAAPHCTLSIATKNEAYTTPSFDEGFPPVEIKSLVDKMLSIYENHSTH